MNSLQIVIVIDILLAGTALFIFLRRPTFKNLVFKNTFIRSLVMVLFHLTYVLISKLCFAEDNWIEDSAPFGLMYGPFLFFLLYSYWNQRLPLKLILLHLSPLFIFGVFHIYMLASGLSPHSSVASLYMQLLYSLIPVSFLSYALWGFWFLTKINKKIRGLIYLFGFFNLSILVIVSFFFFNVIGNSEKLIMEANPESEIGGFFLYSFFALSLIVLIFVFSRKSALSLRQHSDPAVPEIDKESYAIPETSSIAEPSYSKSSLSDDKLLVYERKLDEYVELHQPWKNHDLKLDLLADYLNIQRHHLTQVLNTQKNKNFNSYINEMRVDHVCELMKDKKEEVSLADLGFMSGFNSKSTFYRWFKEIKGMTPAQYYDHLNSQEDE